MSRRMKVWRLYFERKLSGYSPLKLPNQGLSPWTRACWRSKE